MKIVTFVAALVLSLPVLCLAASPSQCASWPRNMAEVHLKNAGITDPSRLDESKTLTVRLASEKIGKDRYHDVYDITFYEKSGATIEVITSSEASSAECSMGGVEVYVVAKKIGGP